MAISFKGAHFSSRDHSDGCALVSRVSFKLSFMWKNCWRESTAVRSTTHRTSESPHISSST